jgi:hypothetical protein
VSSPHPWAGRHWTAHHDGGHTRVSNGQWGFHGVMSCQATLRAIVFVCKDELRLSLCDDPRSESVPPRRTTPPLGVTYARIPRLANKHCNCIVQLARNETGKEAERPKMKGKRSLIGNPEPARGVLFRDPTPCASGGDPAIFGTRRRGETSFQWRKTGHSFKGGAEEGLSRGVGSGPRDRGARSFIRRGVSVSENGGHDGDVSSSGTST